MAIEYFFLFLINVKRQVEIYDRIFRENNNPEESCSQIIYIYTRKRSSNALYAEL
jgi:hypothetical protein